MKVTAVVVTKFDLPLGDVVDSIAPHVNELILVRGVDGVAERWERIATAQNEIIYVQDDDALVDVGAILASYDERQSSPFVTCNMPANRRAEYSDEIALVGWGSVFHRSKVDQAFRRYWIYAAMHRLDWNDEIFRRECDRIFTGLSSLKLIDVPFRHLPQAEGKDRMGREARHGADMIEVRKRIYAVRKG